MRECLSASRPALTRRRFITGLSASGVAGLLAACGTATPTAPPPTTAPTAASVPSTGPAAAAATPAATAAASAGATARSTASAVSPSSLPASSSPRGELRIGVSNTSFINTLDATKDGFGLITSGAAETLMRLTPQGKLEPWLAASITNITSTTWRIGLRPGATFWDGTPVDATAVAAAFQKNWETQPSANAFISKDTQIAVKDAATLEFTTPRPAGDLPFSLVSPFFVIHKPGTNGSIMTGPYRPTKFTVDSELVLEPFTTHWAGGPALAKITLKRNNDANSRILALQAGDLDLLYGLPPESRKVFDTAIETTSTPTTRVHMMLLNQLRPPFNDRAVREATALAIDRAALVTATLDGQGAPAVGMFPENFGVDVVPLQATNTSQAQSVLDAAGWKAGADGVRVNGGTRLAFTLYSYPGRAELTLMAGRDPGPTQAARLRCQDPGGPEHHDPDPGGRLRGVDLLPQRPGDRRSPLSFQRLAGAGRNIQLWRL